MNKTGCLIIHGFAGDRNEIRSLCSYLEGKGFIIATPLLAGHESSLRDLSKSRHTDWIQSAAIELGDLQKKCDKVFVIGFSMGGLIAVNLFNEYHYDGLVFVNTPIYYWAIKRIFYNLYHDFHFFFKKYFIASTNKPFIAMIQFLKLLYRTKPLFSKILCPTLVIQTMDDDTVNPKSADFIYAQVKGKKQLKKYPEGGHVLFQSNSIDGICEEIRTFCADEMLFQ